LRGLDVTIAVPDTAGGLDPIVEKLEKIKKVDSVEVVDVGRI
jgi:translation elongation factor EF-1beta